MRRWSEVAVNLLKASNEAFNPTMSAMFSANKDHQRLPNVLFRPETLPHSYLEFRFR